MAKPRYFYIAKQKGSDFVSDVEPHVPRPPMWEVCGVKNDEEAIAKAKENLVGGISDPEIVKIERKFRGVIVFKAIYEDK